jgi:hypothetical protein
MDGYANLLEYYFVSNPLDGTVDENMPGVVRIDDQPSIRYHRRQNAAVQSGYEVSTDLVQWEEPDLDAVNIIELVEDNGDGTETVSLEIESRVTALFWRIVVE